MRLLILIIFSCVVSSTNAQDHWFKIDRPESQFVMERSLDFISYRMPCFPCIYDFPKRLEILDFYLNKDCTRYKIRLTYHDLSRIDTNDLRHYFLAKVVQPTNYSLTKSEKDSLYLLQNVQHQTIHVTIDTNQNQYLYKKIDNQLYALQYYRESTNPDPSKLKRITGAVDYFANQESQKTNPFSFIDYCQSFEPIDTPKFHIDNLRYMYPSDTIVVYGNYNNSTGFAYRRRYIKILEPKFSKYYTSINAIRYVFVESIFMPITNSSTYKIPIKEYTDRHDVSLGTFVFHQSDKSKLPSLSSSDSTVLIKWKKYASNTYGLIATILTNFDSDRKVNIRMNENCRHEESLYMHLRFE